jgi:hypothetical protein
MLFQLTNYTLTQLPLLVLFWGGSRTSLCKNGAPPDFNPLNTPESSLDNP